TKRKVPAATVVAEGLAPRLRRLAARVELLGRAVAPVSPPLAEESLRVGPVDLEPAGLSEVAAVGAVVLRAFGIPVESEPGHPMEDRMDRVVRRPIAVGVLDPKEEGPLVMTGKQPVEERRPGTADVEVSGGTGREAHADGFSCRCHR